ncbi:MAG: hypothetical protein AB7O26_07565 [Planctomycetaceae bacterium]
MTRPVTGLSGITMRSVAALFGRKRPPFNRASPRLQLASILATALVITSWLSTPSESMADGDSISIQPVIETRSLTHDLVLRGASFLRGELFEASLIVAASLLVGIVAGWLFIRPNRSRFRILIAAGFSLLLCLGGHWVFLGHRPSLIESVPWLIGATFGTAFVAALRARHGRVAKGVCVGVCLVFSLFVAVVGLLAAVTDSAAADFDFMVPSAREKQELVDRLKSTQLLSRDPKKPRDVKLSQIDLNILLGWKSSLDGSRIRSKVLLSDDRFLLMASVPGALPGSSQRYINANATGRVLVDEGLVKLSIDEMRLGGILLPKRTRHRLERTLAAAFQESAELQPLLTSIKTLRIHSGKVEIVAGSPWGSARNDLFESTFNRRLFSPELKFATVEQVEYLLARARMAPGRPTFEELISAAFEKAHQTSQEIDPRDANKAALLALGILVADPQLARLVDYSLSPDAQNVIRRNVRRVRLRGRFDLAQHFCASGALTVTAGNEISDLIGRVKEEIDAGIPGKGFSFVDILADRAGTRFARACIESPQRAAELQEKLRFRVDTDDIFPSIEGLPERIKESELSEEFGGVGGAEYRRWLNEIEARLDQVPLLRAK